MPENLISCVQNIELSLKTPVETDDQNIKTSWNYYKLNIVFLSQIYLQKNIYKLYIA